MSSINTNLSAMTALQSLKSTQSALTKNQNQISTGLRVGEASHNASYWSISTKMKSDNGALGAVKDSIKQSKAMIDTYSSAIDKSLKYLDTMKTKLTAGSNPGADLAAIQLELKASIEGLKSAAGSATFNGQNWLEGTASTVKLVTSFEGSGSTAKVNTLNIDTTAVNLFVDASTGTGGKLGSVASINISGTAATADFVFTNAQIQTGDEISFTLGGNVSTFTVAGETTKSAIAASINSDSVLSELVEATINDNGELRLTAKAAGVDFTAATTDMVAAGTDVNATLTGSASAGTTVGAALQAVDTAINDLRAGSAMLGANKALLETQEEFIGVLSDSLTAGVSAFIDADMNEASTRNQALQTQQQLGVQALSMANQNSQMILKLFQ
ncbi:flagellin [Microvirga zambiensis]|uniref:flagellin n=1 Tax=Microvirga zambiensis TaxID=1402137 RepID=UPI00191D9C7A|nr:flagellin [Microvirga zambiensis]